LQAIRSDEPLRRQIDLDSVDWISVIIGLCHRLSIDVPESDYGRLETLDSTVEYLAARCGDQGAGPSRIEAAASAPLPCLQHRVNDTPVTVRPMRADDAALETDFVQGLSKESRYKRFMVTVRELSAQKLKYLTDVDQVRHVALVATTGSDGQQLIVGVVRYFLDPAGTGCEFAVAVDDAWQGTGLAGLLMHDLMDVARARGLASMEGTVLATNHRMLKFTRQLGFRQERDPESRDTVRVVRAL
jgi:acetyltransferase